MLRNFFILISLIVTFNSLSSQCDVKDTLIDIPDNERPIGVKLVVSGVSNNDLSDPGQGVCNVTLKYSHFQRTELTIDLISPAGQKVRLIGPYNPFSSPNPGNRSWDITFNRCSSLVNPDPGKSQHFNNNDNWGFFTQYHGTYYPHDFCLEQFNTGPVNGTWTFLVYDHEEIYKGSLLGYSIKFCDGSTYDCNTCDANAGFFNTDSVSYCINEPNKGVGINTSFDGMASDPGNYRYHYFILKDSIKGSIVKGFDLDTFSVGKYQIWGISYHKNDSLKIFNTYKSIGNLKFLDTLRNESSGFCADIMVKPLIVVIKPVQNQVTINVSVCEGKLYFFHNEEINKAGTYYFKSVQNECDTTYTVNLSVIHLFSDISAPDTVINCADNGFVTISGLGFVQSSGMEFQWLEFPEIKSLALNVSQPGTYHFVLRQGECTDTAKVKILADNQIPILSYTVKKIDCCNPIGQIDINVTNVSISKYIWKFENITLSNTSSVLKTSQPGIYHIQVLTIDGCSVELDITLPIDTIKPDLTFAYTDISCDNPVTQVSFVSNIPLASIDWVGLGMTGNSILTDTGGLFQVNVIGVNCCIASEYVDIKEYTKKPEVVIQGGALDCESISTDLSFYCSDSLIYFKWILPDNSYLFTKNITVYDTGKYYLQTINEYGCGNLDTFIVKLNNIPPEIITPNSPLILTCVQDSVQLSFSSSSNISKVHWSGPAGMNSDNFAPFVSFEGTYYVTVTGSNHCTSTDSIIVKRDLTLPTAVFITDTITCSDQIINIEAKYSGNYSFEWHDSVNNSYTGSSIIGNVPGLYTITITDLTNNCKSHMTTNVLVDTFISTAIIVGSSLIDCKHDTVSLFLSTYDKVKKVEWFYSGLFLANDDSVKVTKKGVYNAKIYSDNDCVSNISFEVLIGEMIDLSPQTFTLTCADSALVMNLPGVNDSYSYFWRGPGNFISTDSHPVFTKPGNYFVTVNNGNCIDSTKIILLEDKEKPKILIDCDTIIQCVPDYAVLRGFIQSSNVSSFSWSGPGVFSTQYLTYFARNEGRYVFSVKGKNGCTDSLEVDVKRSVDYPEIEVVGDLMNCITGVHPLMVKCKVNGDYYSVEWTGPIGPDSLKYNKLNAVVNRAGKYACAVSNIKNCITRDTVEVVIDTLRPQINFNHIDTLTCYNEFVDIIANIYPAYKSIDWIGVNGFTSDMSNFQAFDGGSYLYSIIGTNGCQAEGNIFVPVDRLKPYIWLTGTIISGVNSKAKVELKTYALHYNTRWKWPDGNESFVDSFRTIIPGFYKVTVTDIDNGCQSIDSILISVDSIPPDLFVQDYFIPCDTSLWVEMHVFSNKPGTKFYWIGPNGFYDEGATTFTKIKGEYIVFAEGTNGIFVSDTIHVIDIKVLPEFGADGGKLTCIDTTSRISAIGVTDDKDFYWEGPNHFISNLREPYVSLPGIYKLVVEGKNGCKDSLEVSVVIDTLKPDFSIITTDSLICENNNAILQVRNHNNQNRNYSYIWSTHSGLIDYGIYSPEARVIGEGEYFVKITDLENGCSQVDSIEIQSKSYKLSGFSADLIIPTCMGYSDGKIIIDSVFGGNPPFSFSRNNFYFSNIKEFNALSAGQYHFFIKDRYGCKLDSILLLQDGNSVYVNLETSQDEVFVGEKVELKANIIAPNQIKAINWSSETTVQNLDSFNILLYPLRSSYVGVEVIDSNGCKDSDQLWITVLSNPDIKVPNIFSPDGDGFNDYFFIKTNKGVKSIREFKIFDRWGELLYFKNNLRLNVPIDGWDGKFNGTPVQVGVYVCYFTIELENGTVESYYTDLTLMK